MAVSGGSGCCVGGNISGCGKAVARSGVATEAVGAGVGCCSTGDCGLCTTPRQGVHSKATEMVERRQSRLNAFNGAIFPERGEVQTLNSLKNSIDGVV